MHRPEPTLKALADDSMADKVEEDRATSAIGSLHKLIVVLLQTVNHRIFSQLLVSFMPKLHSIFNNFTYFLLGGLELAIY